MDLRDRVVLITGASEGIGAACARAFRERGSRVVLTGRSSEKLARIRVSDELVIAADLCDPAARSRIVEEALRRHGRIDVLVNNAGVGLYGPAWNSRDDESRRMWELNFFAPLELIRLAVPHMRERRAGTIVNVSSIAAKVTLPWLNLYSAAKSAMCSLTDGLRMELRADGIHVIAVCPGYVRTDFQKHVLGSARAPQRIANSRAFLITAEQCAEAIVRGVERGSRTVVTPRVGWAFVVFARLFPRVLDWYLPQMQMQRGIS